MKTCFKCGLSKPPELFYKHRLMADGRLGKCIECTKRDVAARVEVKKLDPEWVDYERERQRAKQLKAHSEGRSSPPKMEYRIKWASENRNKVEAQRLAYYAKKRGRIQVPETCSRCGCVGRIQMHHSDYSKPLEVQFLCAKCHGFVHRIKSSKTAVLT